jgi:hypothetical protein
MAHFSSWRGRDWLGQVQLLLVACGAVFVAFGIGALVALIDGAAVCTDVLGAPPAVVVSGLRSGVTPGATVSVCAESPTGTQSALAFLVDGVWPLVVAVAAVLLHQIVRDARRADPFTPATVRRMRQLAVFVLLAGGAATTLEMVASDALAGSLVDGGFHRGDAPVWTWLAVALGLAAVAEIVKRGVALRAELDTVI